MINNSLRIGNITSSEGAVVMMGEAKRPMTDAELKARPASGPGSSAKMIVDLSIFPDSALNYIEECNWERKLGRSLETESNARPLTWGKAVEKRVFELLGISYQLVSHDTIQHPSIKYWVGSPDANVFDRGRTVVDIKCPITLKSFCQLVDPLYAKKKTEGMQAMNLIRDKHKDGEKYYWQLVSNAILTKSKYAELIIYAPYESELLEIQQMCAPSSDCPKQWNWIYYADHDELPSLKDGGFYKNINVIRFEVPAADKKALTQRMKLAGKYLVKI